MRDADGNAVGGVRLPHMTSMLAGGRKAGALLGQYSGFAYGFAKDNLFFTISGEFKPFSARADQGALSDARGLSGLGPDVS